MAILIPNDRAYQEFNGSVGEHQLYENFKKLSEYSHASNIKYSLFPTL